MESSTSTTKPEPHRRSAADALTFNVASLLSDPLGTIRDLEVDAPPMELADGLGQTRGTTGRLRLTRTNRGLFVHARLETGLAQSCSRCLRDLDWPVQIEIDEEALPTIDVATGKPLDTEAEPDVLRVNDHHELELESEVRDAIELAEPIAPLCREDCPGLCLVCGLELGSGPHDHPDEAIDPRMEGLRRLIDGD
jgi:uncharacterized protein